MPLYISVIFTIFVLNILGLFSGYFWKTDKYTDISYSLSFVCGAFLLSKKFFFFSAFHSLLFLMILIWAIRLGGFLLYRIIKMGRDNRFDQMRSSFIRFGGFWLLQAVSVIIILAPVFVMCSRQMEIGIVQYFAIALFALGLILESHADWKKFIFKTKSPQKLLMSGIYKYVQFPNYTGELLIWLSIWLYGSNYYQGWEWWSVISPIWIFILLRYISGIPLIIDARKKKYATDSKESAYIESTPYLIPSL